MKTYLLMFLLPVGLLLGGCNVYYADQATKRGVEAFDAAKEAKKHGDDQAAADNYRRAQLEFETAIDQDPNSPDRYYNLGMASQALKQYKRALGEYGQALEYFPGHGEARKGRIDCLVQMNASQRQIDDEVAEAVGTLHAREHGRIHLGQAAAYARVGRVADTPAVLERALVAALGDAHIHALAGRLYRAIGDASSAKRCFIIAYKLDPDEPDIAADLGSLGERLPTIADY